MQPLRKLILWRGRLQSCCSPGTGPWLSPTPAGACECPGGTDAFGFPVTHGCLQGDSDGASVTCSACSRHLSSPPCHRLEPGLKTLSALLQGSPDCFTLYSALLFFFYFSQQLVFNSVTNCLGPRKFLHSGKLYKAKSNKELYGFLFNDFLLLTQIIKPLGSSGTDKVFSPKSNLQYKMYKTVSAALARGWGQGSGAPCWGCGQEPS